MINPPAKETLRLKIKIPREEIVFIDMIFKSYGGLALVTVDRLEEGILFLDVTEGTRPDVLAILKDLQKRIPLTILEDGGNEEG
ncbi:MAG: DUF4911 domain-containing protein [Halanaerobiaceae bacterium]